MDVVIANPRWRGNHSRRMRNAQLFVSGERSMNQYFPLCAETPHYSDDTRASWYFRSLTTWLFVRQTCFRLTKKIIRLCITPCKGNHSVVIGLLPESVSMILSRHVFVKPYVIKQTILERCLETGNPLISLLLAGRLLPTISLAIFLITTAS